MSGSGFLPLMLQLPLRDVDILTLQSNASLTCLGDTAVNTSVVLPAVEKLNNALTCTMHLHVQCTCVCFMVLYTSEHVLCVVPI